MRVSLTNLLAVLLILAGINVNPTLCFDDELAKVTANLPFNLKQIELPKIPARTVKLTDFSAVGDGTVQNTVAFAKAIDACAKSGGGRVVVPEGIWLTGPIQLKSNIDLHLERGAVIQFS
jgi:hypothetical protein